MYGVYGAVSLIRTACFLYAARFPPEPGAANTFIRLEENGFFYFIGVLCIVCCSIGWLVMTDERRYTELKEQEARAHAMAERAAAADAAKGEFLAIIGHEIRNPLSAVLSLTDLVLGTELTAEQKEYVIGVRTSMEALLRVTDDVLDLSKIESGRLATESSPFDIFDLVEGIVKVFRPVALGRGLDLDVELDAPMPRRLLGDAGRIRQVITNLLGNAMKFSKKGRVHIAVACQSLPGAEAVVRISVTDQGIGIPPEMMGTLFNKFSGAHTATAKNYGGTGIGLAISMRLIELMGGRLGAESQVGKGSTFWFELNLPIAPQSAGAQSA
jgi:signal transduction histidine kinase